MGLCHIIYEIHIKHLGKVRVQTVTEILCCSFCALSRMNLQDNQQNALSCFINIYVTLHHRKFLHVSICKIIREHKLMILHRGRNMNYLRCNVLLIFMKQPSAFCWLPCEFIPDNARNEQHKVYLKLHLQPFTNSNLHFPIAVGLAVSEVCFSDTTT